MLCLYARHPGKRFTVKELSALLETELPSERADFNVNDFIGQLARRGALIPVERDSTGSFLPESVGIYLVENAQTEGR